MAFECKSEIWKKISKNIKEVYSIDNFKVEVFSDGSGSIIHLSPSYQELTQVFTFDNVEQIITKFLTVEK
jgi:hypothetical protein